ncbi:MAG: DNA recombination protein RmuC, partial [Succinivibrio sp.]|nr:DNA recombination protein RmuC [Succinivibrio sp.]
MLDKISFQLPDNLPLLLSAGLGLIFLLLTLYLSVRQASLKARLHASERLSLERQNLLQQLKLEVQRLRERELKFSRANAALFERREVLEQKSAELNAEKERLLESLTALREENTRLKERNADFRSKIDALDQLRDEDHERFRISSQELESRLVSLGERMLKERGEALTKLSSSQFQEAVRPLKAELEVFRGFLHKSEQQSAQQAGALQQELNNLQKAQLKLSAQADSLSQALQSGGKSQGMWGE